MENKIFKRNDPLFSLCGLNCSLCPSFVRGNCPGCMDGSYCASMCPFAPCSIEHGNIEYCFECDEYPCEKYDEVDRHDSIISHLNQKKDMLKARRIGIEKYHAEQLVKIEILNEFLSKYDNGHRDIFFCLAVNLMDIEDLKDVLKCAENLTSAMNMSDKSDCVKQLLIECAGSRNIVLKLRNDGYYGVL